MNADIRSYISSLLETSNAEVLEEGLVTLCCSEVGREKPDAGWPRVLLACSVLNRWAKTDEDRRTASTAIETLEKAEVLRNERDLSISEQAKHCMAFKKLVQMKAQIVPVSGDGDCLFRSVVHVLFNRRNLPKELEDDLSVLLRRRCTKVRYNDAPEAERRRHTEEDWNAKFMSVEGMSQHGTFADTAEVYKLAVLLSLPSNSRHHLPGAIWDTFETDRELWVVRYDDNVSFDNGLAKPGDYYMFCHGSFPQAEGSQRNPRDSEIRVYFDPYVCNISTQSVFQMVTVIRACDRATGTMKEFF